MDTKCKGKIRQIGYDKRLDFKLIFVFIFPRLFFFHQIIWFSRQSSFCSQHTSDLLFFFCSVLCVCVCLKEGWGCGKPHIQN